MATVAPITLKQGPERREAIGKLTPCVLCDNPLTGKPPKRQEEVTDKDMLCRTHNLMFWPLRDARNIFHSLVK